MSELVIARGPSLETFGMTKTFGRFTALNNVSIKVPAGTFHALLGENGAGKSTLVKCVMGFYSPDKGTMQLNGAGRRRQKPERRAGARASAWSISISRWFPR